jgi:hypothetical protein
MSRYGIDYYGLAYYGYDNPVTYDASPVVAKPWGHGSIRVTWNPPSGSWSRLLLVRNPYGYPTTPWDGTQVLTVYNGASVVGYIDSELTQGQYYYYSIFVYSLLQYSWVIAGQTMALSVKDYKNSDIMYSYLPDIYRISEPYTTTSDTWDNPALKSFLDNFGFELDYDQTMVGLLTNKYDIEKVNGLLVPTMMNQFGQTYEPSIGLQQNRRILRDAVTLNKQKGSKEGLVAFIKDFTGWPVPIPIAGTPNPSVNGITISHNIMLDYNDSSFEESIGHWVSVDGTADIDQLNTYNITSVSVSSGTATFVIGPHNYDSGNQVIIQGLPYPIFNSTSPVTLTATNQVTGTVSVSTSSADLSSITGYNQTTGTYGTLSPAPAPWVEPTAPTLFPNKASGILALYNTSTSAQTINAFCGDDYPITNGIPVTAGTTYTFSVYASSGNYTDRNVTAKIKWFDRFNNLLSTSSGSSVSDSAASGFTSSVRPYVSDAAPTGAYYACPGVSIASVGGSATNEHHYFDAAQFEASASPSAFDEARQLHVTLRANRINELKNPHFASPLTPWTTTGATATVITSFAEPNVETFTITSASITSNVATVNLNLTHSYQIGQTVVISNVTGPNASNYNGTRTITTVTSTSFTYNVTAGNSSVTSGTVFKTGNGMQLSATSTGTVVVKSWDSSTTAQLMGIYYPNTSYTFSVYVNPQTSSENVTLKISWYNSSHSLISTATSSSFACGAYAWSRPYITATAPATAAYAAVELDWTTAATSDLLLLDEALFENNGLVLDYFDGTYGPGTVYDLLWEGGQSNANAARSHLYKNRFAIQTRLFGATLNAQAPMGTTIAVYLAQPQT